MRGIMTTLDCRGLRCPMPLIKMRQWLAHACAPSQLTLLVNDPGSISDIPRYLAKHDIKFESAMQGDARLKLVVFAR